MYAAIEAITLREGPPVSAVCEVLEVSRSAYHAWLTRDPSVREERDAVLSPLVHDIFWKCRQPIEMSHSEVMGGGHHAVSFWRLA